MCKGIGGDSRFDKINESIRREGWDCKCRTLELPADVVLFMDVFFFGFILTSKDLDGNRMGFIGFFCTHLTSSGGFGL